MKTKLYSLIAATAVCGLASAAVTTPVGLVVTTLPAAATTLVGLTLHQPTAVAGVIDAVTATTITDTDVDFTTALLLGQTYVLELADGTIQEITSWTVDTLTTTDDLTGVVTASVTTYSVRKASTISDIFGAANSAGLTATASGTPGTYDEILVVDASGTAFVTCFYYDDGSFTAWYDTLFNDVSQLPLVYADSMYVRRIAGSSLDLVVTGEVKTTETLLMILPGNTFLGSVNPVGTTLGNSGIKDFLAPDDGVNPFDKVLIQQPDGSYITYNYYNDGSFEEWYDSLFNPSSGIPLSTGMVIQSQTVTQKPIKINAPVISP